LIGLSKESTHFRKLGLTADLKKSLDTFRSGLQNPTFDAMESTQMSHAGELLYQYLLEPLDSMIKKLESLIIIPDGQLAFIPFEALSLNTNSTKQYVLEKWDISYASSVSFLASTSLNNRDHTKQALLAIAPSTEQFSNKSNSSLPYIKWAEKEIQLISKHISSEMLTGDMATEENFRRKASGFSVIHLATHGLVDDEFPMNTKLYFAKNDEENGDGFLYTRELFGLHIPSEMVVLSACDTGNGKIVKGEGVISLAKGFFYAGAESVVMSLWKANDKSSSAIMNDFYKYLSKGYDKSRAMKQAKLNYLANAKGFEANPALWAQFVVNGNVKPIHMEAEQQYPKWVIAVFLLLILLIVMKKTIMRKSAA